MDAGRDPWRAFPIDPRDRAHAALRASDQDRAVLQQLLGEAFAEGRLDREEYDERSDAAASVRTLGDVPALLGDLIPTRPVDAGSDLVLARPEDLRRMAVRSWESSRRSAVAGFAGASIVCWAIWVATSFGGGDGFDPYFPWPLIVMAAALANLVKVMVTREEAVAEEVRRLERKQAKEIAARRKRGWGPLGGGWSQLGG